MRINPLITIALTVATLGLFSAQSSFARAAATVINNNDEGSRTEVRYGGENVPGGGGSVTHQFGASTMTEPIELILHGYKGSNTEVIKIELTLRDTGDRCGPAGYDFHLMKGSEVIANICEEVSFLTAGDIRAAFSNCQFDIGSGTYSCDYQLSAFISPDKPSGTVSVTID